MHFKISSAVIGVFKILLSSCMSILDKTSSSLSSSVLCSQEFSSLMKSRKLSIEGVFVVGRLFKLFKYFQYSFGDFLCIFLNFIC